MKKDQYDNMNNNKNQKKELKIEGIKYMKKCRIDGCSSIDVSATI